MIFFPLQLFHRILVVAENALKAAGKRPRDKHIPGSHVEDCSCPDCSFEVAFACIRLAISKHTDLFDAKPLEKDLTVAKSRDKSDTSRLASVKVVLERERRKVGTFLVYFMSIKIQSKGPSSKTVYAAFEIQKRHENVLFRCGTIVCTSNANLLQCNAQSYHQLPSDASLLIHFTHSFGCFTVVGAGPRSVPTHIFTDYKRPFLKSLAAVSHLWICH